MTHFTNEDWATEQELFREFANGALSVLLVGIFDNTVTGSESLEGVLEENTYPQPFETPVGVIKTSAKRTSPANQTEKESSHQ